MDKGDVDLMQTGVMYISTARDVINVGAGAIGLIVVMIVVCVSCFLHKKT